MSFSLNGSTLECNGQSRQLEPETVLAVYRVLTSKLANRDLSNVSNLKKLKTLFELEFEPDEDVVVSKPTAPKVPAPVPVSAKVLPSKKHESDDDDDESDKPVVKKTNTTKDESESDDDSDNEPVVAPKKVAKSAPVAPKKK